MKLWNTWYELVKQLRSSCKRSRSFHWLVVILAGLTIKLDAFGVTSIARGVFLSSKYYTCMLKLFVSRSIDLEKLVSSWISLIFEKFNGIVKVNGRYLIIADGIKIAKEGKKMPGVKRLHQASSSNSKPPFIMGHSLQAVGILVKGIKGYFTLPLTAKIHEGVNLSCNDKRTLLDKLLVLLTELTLPDSYYLIADKYYGSGRLMKGLIKENIHLVTMMKKHAVAYHEPKEEERKHRGRPKRYGKRVKLFDLFKEDMHFTKATLSLNENVKIEYCVLKLLYRPLGDFVQFVLVKHPIRGQGIVMSTDLTQDSLDILHTYSLRFKIEVMFKQAVHTIKTFSYRFWMKTMKKIKRGKRYPQLQFAPPAFKEKVEEKLRAYHIFIQLGIIAQGLLQYLSIHHHQSVWKTFGSWLRTIREVTLPSERTVACALRRTYLQFLKDDTTLDCFKKFLRKRVTIEQLTEPISAFKEVA